MKIPETIEKIIKNLEENGFEAYAVGGCVRDFLLGKNPKDWDIATNAKPEEVEKLMTESGRKTFYENEFWTVGVVCPELKDQGYEETVEITTFRAETKYSDKRHPDEIKPAKTIEEDLARRDFTVNAIALSSARPGAKKPKIIDPFGGKSDLKKKIIRAVGNPKDRFSEDALRMMRAVRFNIVLGFKFDKETEEAVKNNSSSLKAISQERIRDEFVKIIMAEKAADGVEKLRQLGLLKQFIPELEEGYEVGQNKHHIYDCYTHSLLSLKYASQKNFNFYVRLAALFHDIAKPRTKVGQGLDSTFYNHEIVGARMVKQILERLRFPKDEIRKIVLLVRYHLFYYNVGEVSESSVRRLVKNAGIENMEELLQVRMSDRIGSGVPKAEPYKLRHLKYLIEKVSQDPISAKMLAINGSEIMAILNTGPGPKIGQILAILLAEVLSEPKNNDKQFLKQETERLAMLADNDLAVLAKKAKTEVETLETKADEMTKSKYWVT